MVFYPEISIDSVYDLLVGKIKSYFQSAGMKKAVIGLSGGIDSAVVALLAADALGAENVHGILMPNVFNRPFFNRFC